MSVVFLRVCMCRETTRVQAAKQLLLFIDVINQVNHAFDFMY